MIDLVIREGNLFNAKMGDNSYFVHSCNSQCQWGAGIALQFKKRYPQAFMQYCSYLFHEKPPIGTAFIAKDGRTKIGCLFVSWNWGDKKDCESSILRNTKLAILDLIEKIPEKDFTIHSPMINSGLFDVPWEKTKELIESINTDKSIIWDVWDLKAGNLVKS